jgi:hypothetical protein
MLALMRKPTPYQLPQIAHVSIVLDEVVPEVSRVVAVPIGIHLGMLHLVIQAAMGWTNTHLWLFNARGCTWGEPDHDYPDGTMPAGDTLLLDMIADIGTNRIEYVYDFGDHWSHTVTVVKPMRAVPGVAYPLLIDAVGRCPLEDSGGPFCYMEALDALRDSTHPRHAEMLEWPGADFDPSAVNRAQLEKNVADLAAMITPRRRKAAKAKAPSKPRKSKFDESF